MTELTRQRLRYIAGDFVAVSLGWLAFNAVRYHSLPVDWAESFGTFLLGRTVLLGQVLVPFLLVALFAISGYYNIPYLKSRVDDLLNSAAVAAVASVGIFFAVLINDDIPERLLNYQLLILLWVLLFVPVMLARMIVTASSKRQGYPRYPTLIVGSGVDTDIFIRRLKRTPGAAIYDIQGITTPDQALDAASSGVADTFIISESLDAKHMEHLVGRLVELGCRVYVRPDLYSILTVCPRISSVTNEPLVCISSPSLSPATSNLKRIGDALASACALVLLSPVMLAIAAAVRLDSHGPVFYRQERIGLHGHPFCIYKFRSMRTDAESSGPQLSSDGDPRITRVGAVLRKYRLDELPQFWNVLCGDMSLVGPRPERAYYLKQIAERAPYVSLLRSVRPGITSWGMVKYGYACNIDQMVERLPYELLYIENVSLGVDLRILLHTVNTIITGKGV